jgi:hypothetical protein
MNDLKIFTTIAIACALLVATPAALGQSATVDWQGQDSEFGSIRAPYIASMDGERVPIEARIVLRENYEEKESRFFMFAFTVENTPLDVQFDNIVRMDTGAEMPCYQRQGDRKSAIKCFVDLKDMPEAGTEIRMYGTLGSSKQGMFQAGAIVVPFTYTWMRVQMSNGLNAELYAGTQVTVDDCPSKCGFGGTGNPAAIPGVSALGVAAAALVAVGIVALKRRK